MVELKLGLKGTITTTVGDSDLASALGSGDVPVLGTPRMIALAEAATVAAVAGCLEEGRTSVGTHVDMRHLAPSPKGRSVTAMAELTAIDGKLLTFRIEVHDGDRLVGDGIVERAIVNRERFIG
ncbi:MAG TPA: hotdog domain-containing protein [Novosphingobium sp.]|jgi:predicted thioesterase|nr:hotdog domain-containing protein [Novosphingobium sp.]